MNGGRAGTNGNAPLIRGRGDVPWAGVPGVVSEPPDRSSGQTPPGPKPAPSPYLSPEGLCWTGPT